MRSTESSVDVDHAHGTWRATDSRTGVELLFTDEEWTAFRLGIAADKFTSSQREPSIR